MGEPDDSQNYLLFNYPESVTYFSQTSTGPPPTSGGITVANALRERVEKTMSGPGGALLRQVVLHWHIPQAQLGSVVPKFGDVIRDAAGHRYTVSESLGQLQHEEKVYGMWRVPTRAEQ